ncbi:MAG TPA: hypothetical protein VNO79_12670 [Actinomycetota bacterium]|nr:hypothetical protein [Actinomycetota bacterium]
MAFRVGGGLLGVGLAADLVAHATGAAGDPRVALAAHLPALLGMAVCTGGLLGAGLRGGRRPAGARTFGKEGSR